MKPFLSILICFLFSGSLFGQPEVEVSVNSTTVTVGQPFEITYSVNEQGNFQRPDFSPFRVAGGPYSSTSMQIINGNTSVKSTLSFHLVAVSEGTFTIPPASVQTRSGVAKSKAVTITVVKGNGNVPPAGSGQRQPGQMTPQAPRESEDLFVRATVNKKTAYQGEAINLVFRVYTRVDLRNVQPRKMPSLTGFWSEDYDYTKQAQFSEEVINGVRYNVADLKRMVLFPQKTGELTIDPIEMDFTVRRRVSTGDPFMDQFFGNFQHDQVSIASLPLTIKVNPLPRPEPDKFTGAVGKFSVNSSVDQTETRANEAIRYTFSISGSGNMNLVNEPEIDFPADFEVYDAEVKDKLQPSAQGMQGSRQWEYLLIPRHKGIYEIPAFTFNYFDPKSGKYTPLETGSFTLQVEEGDSASISREEIRQINQDIRFIHQNAELEEEKFKLTGNLFHAGAVAAPVGAFFLIMLLAARRKRESADVKGMKSKKALHSGLKRLKKAEELMNTGKKNEFIDEVFHSLYQYLSHRFKVPAGELDKDRIHLLLDQNGVGSGTRNKFISLLDEAEFLRFAPSGKGDLNSLLTESINVLKSTESEIK